MAWPSPASWTPLQRLCRNDGRKPVAGSMLPYARVVGPASRTPTTCAGGSQELTGTSENRKRWGMKDLKLRLMARFREEGQALAEYSLILAFVFMACVVALGLLGLALSGRLDAVTAGFP